MLHGLHKESPRIKNYGTFPLSLGRSSKSFQPTPRLYVQWQKVKMTYMVYALLSYVKSVFAINLYMPHQSAQFLQSFSVQTAPGVRLGFSTQLIVYSNLKRIWLILMNLCHFLRFKCFKVFDSDNIFDGSQNIGWLKFGIHISGLIVTWENYLLKLHMLSFN